jgi:hypothetical protein
MSNTPPDGPSMATPSEQPDLQSRIATRRAALIKTLVELKADTRAEAAVTRDKLKAKLSDLAHVVKWGIVDGWVGIGKPLTDKLEHWLVETAPQVRA